MKSTFIICLIAVLYSNEISAQFEDEEIDSTLFSQEGKEIKFKPSVYLRFGSFHGFGRENVFNNVPFTKGIGLSFDYQRFSFGLEMDFFNFKYTVIENDRNNRAYHIKAVVNFDLLDSPKHKFYAGASFGRLETFHASYSEAEYDPEIAIYNSQRYWVASPQLTYHYLIPFGSESKWGLKLGGYASYSIPIQGYYFDNDVQKLPNKELWHLDGALQFGVSVGVTQLRF